MSKSKKPILNYEKISVNFRPVFFDGTYSNSYVNENTDATVQIVFIFSEKIGIGQLSKLEDVSYEHCKIINDMLANNSLCALNLRSDVDNLKIFSMVKTEILYNITPETNFDVYNDWVKETNNIKKSTENKKLLEATLKEQTIKR